MSETGDENKIVMSDAEKRRQRMRSIAIAFGLVALAVLFFLVTVVRMGANVVNRPL